MRAHLPWQANENLDAFRDTFLLWDYFDIGDVLRNRSAPLAELTWADMVTLRIDLWVDKLEKTGDKRFTIEKDKCMTMKMLTDMNLPHPTVRIMWSADEFSRERLRVFLLQTKYPAILKLGHIHQQRSTLFLTSLSSVSENMDEYMLFGPRYPKTLEMGSLSPPEIDSNRNLDL